MENKKSSSETLKGLLVLRMIEFDKVIGRARWTMPIGSVEKELKSAEKALRAVCEQIDGPTLFHWSSLIHSLNTTDWRRIENVLKDYWTVPKSIQWVYEPLPK
jgi:hypothetical protein